MYFSQIFGMPVILVLVWVITCTKRCVSQPCRLYMTTGICVTLKLSCWYRSCKYCRLCSINPNNKAMVSNTAMEEFFIAVAVQCCFEIPPVLGGMQMGSDLHRIFSILCQGIHALHSTIGITIQYGWLSLSTRECSSHCRPCGGLSAVFHSWMDLGQDLWFYAQWTWIWHRQQWCLDCLW